MKKTAENFAESENSSTFAAVLRMSCGVMVARRILVPPVRVRILPRQQKTLTIFSQASLFCAYNRRYAAECILVDNNVDDKHMHYSKCLSSALLLMACFTLR